MGIELRWAAECITEHQDGGWPPPRPPPGNPKPPEPPKPPGPPNDYQGTPASTNTSHQRLLHYTRDPPACSQHPGDTSLAPVCRLRRRHSDYPQVNRQRRSHHSLHLCRISRHSPFTTVVADTTDSPSLITVSANCPFTTVSANTTVSIDADSSKSHYTTFSAVTTVPIYTTTGADSPEKVTQSPTALTGTGVLIIREAPSLGSNRNSRFFLIKWLEFLDMHHAFLVIKLELRES